MKRRQYLAAVIRLYLEQPDTPAKASRNDWAIAGDLYRLGLEISDLEHLFRLVDLRRRAADRPQLIRSLAYYRAALRLLTPDEKEPGYVRYVELRHRQLGRQCSSRETAARSPESRAF